MTSEPNDRVICRLTAVAAAVSWDEWMWSWSVNERRVKRHEGRECRREQEARAGGWHEEPSRCSDRNQNTCSSARLKHCLFYSAATPDLWAHMFLLQKCWASRIVCLAQIEVRLRVCDSGLMRCHDKVWPASCCDSEGPLLCCDAAGKHSSPPGGSPLVTSCCDG